MAAQHLNHAEVVTVLGHHGFVAVEPGELSVREQINLFAGAQAVIGLHGAGMTNIAFAPRGATVIELQPAGLDWARTVLFWNIAAVAGHRYAQVVCASRPNRGATDRSESHVEVDVDDLDRTLAQVLPAV